MCTNPPGFNRKIKNYNLKNVVKTFKYKLEIDREGTINITGGEPLLHPQFVELMNYVSSFKKRIALYTNGRLLNYYKLLKTIAKMKNILIGVSIHGNNAKIHERITLTKKSFEQTINGLKRLLKVKNKEQLIEVRIVITKLNYQYIKKTLDYLKREFSAIDRAVLIFHEIEGLAIKNIKKVLVTYTKFGEELKKINIEEYPFEVRLYHFPLCVVPKGFWQNIYRTQEKKDVKYITNCRSCKHKKECMGINKGYLKYKNGKEFKPIKVYYKYEGSNDYHHPIVKLLS
ncbi:MAG: radical SAM protein [Candidatus Margulisbacteria bacterium]|nr:radical SAM protein [Candidatus Margulisiibacteriota bacterium]